jgi:hypothetical protein
MTGKQQLPNATAVLVLGICSIVLGCFGIGVICGIIGLVLSSTPRRMYRENPEQYDNYGSLNAGFIMCIIGTALGALDLLWIIYAIIVGSSAFWWSTHHYTSY